MEITPKMKTIDITDAGLLALEKELSTHFDNEDSSVDKGMGQKEAQERYDELGTIGVFIEELKLDKAEDSLNLYLDTLGALKDGRST